jgi:hypothetical protein
LLGGALVPQPVERYFLIQAVDSFGNHQQHGDDMFSAQIVSASVGATDTTLSLLPEVTITYLHKGSYNATYVTPANFQGLYQLIVLLDGIIVSNTSLVFKEGFGMQLQSLTIPHDCWWLTLTDSLTDSLTHSLTDSLTH